MRLWSVKKSSKTAVSYDYEGVWGGRGLLKILMKISEIEPFSIFTPASTLNRRDFRQSQTTAAVTAVTIAPNVTLFGSMTICYLLSIVSCDQLRRLHAYQCVNHTASQRTVATFFYEMSGRRGAKTGLFASFDWAFTWILVGTARRTDNNQPTPTDRICDRGTLRNRPIFKGLNAINVARR
jgi:hypothetical protein